MCSLISGRPIMYVQVLSSHGTLKNKSLFISSSLFVIEQNKENADLDFTSYACMRAFLISLVSAQKYDIHPSIYCTELSKVPLTENME